jgi:hypothetical protein
MGHIMKDQTAAASARAEPASAGPVNVGPEGQAMPRELLQMALDKGRALMRVYFHSRKVHAAANALARALADSREASSWPGDRLPVGKEMSEQVERLTRRLKLETEAQNRLAAPFRTADSSHSAPAH